MTWNTAVDRYRSARETESDAERRDRIQRTALSQHAELVDILESLEPGGYTRMLWKYRDGTVRLNDWRLDSLFRRMMNLGVE